MSNDSGRPPSREEQEVNRVALLLMAEWERQEGKRPGISYIATFADMARAVIADTKRQLDELHGRAEDHYGPLLADAVKGVCGYSGMTFRDCQRSICDCFLPRVEQPTRSERIELLEHQVREIVRTAVQDWNIGTSAMKPRADVSEFIAARVNAHLQETLG